MLNFPKSTSTKFFAIICKTATYKNISAKLLQEKFRKILQYRLLQKTSLKSPLFVVCIILCACCKNNCQFNSYRATTGTQASNLSGDPLPPLIFIGAATIYAPFAGTCSRFAMFSYAVTLLPQRVR